MLAARIAGRFHIDPILVLKATTTEWAVRQAAWRIVRHDDIEEQKRAAQKKPK